MATSEIKMSMSLATAKVTTALGNLRTKISGFASSANEKLGSVAKMASGALAAAFTVAAKSALEYGKEVKNLADLSDAGFEEFQKMAVAAKTVGIEQDKLADIYKDFNERVGQFLRGDGGELAPFFEGVGKAAGVTAEQMAALSGPQAMQLFVKTLEDAGVGSEELSSYMEDVASDATALIPLYKDNAKLLNELGDAAEKNGQIMSKSTADALAKSQIAIDNFKQKAVIFVGDIISGKADNAALKALGARFGALMAQVGEWMTNGFLGALKALTAGLMATTEVWRTNMNKVAKLIGLAFIEAFAPVINKLADLVKLTPAGLLIDVDKFKVNAAEIKKEIDGINFNNPKDDWKKFNGQLLEGLGEWKISTQGSQDAWNDLADTYDRIADTSGVVEESLEERKQTAEEIAKAAAKSAKAAKEAAAEEKKLAETVRLQAELKEAIEHGDVERIKLAEEALKREQDILKTVDEQGVSYDQAANYVDNIIAKEKELADEKNAQAAKEEAQAQKMIAMERDLLNAVLSGDEIAARAAQKKIDLEQRAMEIMQQLKVSYEEAYAIAQKLARIEAGPDLNDSGFTTRFEQREFNRQQKQRDKALDNARKQEERDQRDQGGWIPNVSNERRKTDFAKVNMLKAKDETARRAENKKIGNMVRGGMDRAEAEAQFAAARAQRARGIDEARAAQKKFGIQDPKIKAKEEADAKAKADWEKEFDDMKDKGGLGPDGKQPGPDGKQPGPDGKQPEPKKPDQAIAEGLQAQAGKLDEQIAILTEISASLKC